MIHNIPSNGGMYGIIPMIYNEVRQMDYRGFLIACERLRKNWSQEGLCKGICTVSYLSKIESGKAVPSAEIWANLLARLGLEYDPALDAEAAALAETGYGLLFAFRMDALDRLLETQDLSRYSATEASLDLELLHAIQHTHQRLSDTLEPCMDTRSLALQRILQDRCDEAVRLLPNAYTHLMQGVSAYNRGSYATAINALQNAYELAAKEGLSRIMLECQLFMGTAIATNRIFPIWSGISALHPIWQKICRIFGLNKPSNTTWPPSGLKWADMRTPTVGFLSRHSPASCPCTNWQSAAKS